MRVSQKAVAVLAALALTGVMAVPAWAASPAPAWRLTVTSYPTVFPSPAASSSFGGPGYFIVATNVGGADTSGPFTITDTLPSVLTATSARIAGMDNQLHQLSCSVSGQTVTCTGSEPVVPDGWVAIHVPLSVAAEAPEAIGDQATVEGGGATTSTSSTETTTGTSSPLFGFLSGSTGFDTAITSADGSPVTQAGAHPYQLTVATAFPSIKPRLEVQAAGAVRGISVDLPRGMVVDPQATPIRCSETQLENDLRGGAGCPDAAQVGVVSVEEYPVSSPVVSTTPLYNMVPVNGVPAELGFDALNLGIYVHLMGAVNSAGDYSLSATANDIIALQAHPVLGAEVHLWGDPSEEGHDPLRGACTVNSLVQGSCPRSLAAESTPFLTMPSACSGPLTSNASADSWQEPERIVQASAITEDTAGEPVGVTGCESLDFTPSLRLRPTASATDSPTGLNVDLHVPQNESFGTLAEANLEYAKVTLPTGVVVNPSAANGLAACSAEQIGLTSPVGQSSAIHFTGERAGCPEASKIGTVEVNTPLLDHPLPGAVYLARQTENPFGSLLALYIAVDDPQSGVVIKLAGHVEADPLTGRLTATFDENPELPFEDFKLDFFGGPAATLSTPAVCGSFQTESELSPWSGTAPVHATDSFTVAEGPSGASCVGSEAELPNAPSLEAGMLFTNAGSYSPFVLELSREDGSQRFSALNVSLPPGLVGKIAGIEECPQADIEAAQRRSHEGEGAAEEAHPSCPVAAAVGVVKVGAGSGTPFYAGGHVYLAGPYKGAPFSLVIDTPAVAGPFDLGNVVVRAGLYIDPHTAQVTVKSDPIPSILYGIPLDVRSIDIEMSRKDFTISPTSCEAMAVTGTETSTAGQTAALSDRFQVGGCAGLGFEPTLKAETRAHHSRKSGSYLKVAIAAKEGEANLGKVHVTLPKKLPAELETLKQACTEAQFDANLADCPKAAFVGSAIVHTPLLSEPLTGPAIYVSHGHLKFPDLALVLQGEGVTIIQEGLTNISESGFTSSSFEAIPDVPVSSIELTLPEQENPALGGNGGNLCARPLYMPTKITGQNGAVLEQKTKIAVSGCKPELDVLGHKAKGAHAHIRVKVPAAGKLVASGRGLEGSVRHAGKAKVLSIAVALNGAERHRLADKPHKRVKANVKLRFVPKHGKAITTHMRLLLG